MAKLNKFFALKTNFIEGDPDLIRSGVPMGTGSGSSGGPIALTLAQIKSELDGLDAKLESRGLQGDALTAAREQARAELVKLMRENDEITFSEEDFAKAVGLTPAQATAQYYTYDFTDKDYLFPKSGDYGVVIRSAFRDYDPDSEAAYEARGGKSVFATKPDSSFTPADVTLEDVRVATDFAAPTPDQLAARLDAFLPRDRQVARVTQDTPAFTVADTLGTTMFDRINFPERTINRGVPVVTKGIDAQGNPTTGITMGTAAASPSGPTIGELDISAILPSTGMGINADGSGTATVGTQGTTGNIVASSADTLNMIDTGVAANPISPIDPNVLGTQGNMVNQGSVTPVVTPTPIAQDGSLSNQDVTSSQQPLSIVEQIAQIVREEEASLKDDFSEANKKLAIERGKKRIAELGLNTPGGITAEQVAAGGRASQANRLLNLDTAATVDAVRDVIQREYQPDFSADTPYMVEDKTVYTFAEGGEVEDSRDAAVGSRLMAQAGIGSMQAKNMSPEMADSLDRIMARRK